MKSLFVIKAHLISGDQYYWAENEQEAIDMYNENLPDGWSAEPEVERVWANNKDKAYRGYVVKE